MSSLRILCMNWVLAEFLFWFLKFSAKIHIFQKLKKRRSSRLKFANLSKFYKKNKNQKFTTKDHGTFICPLPVHFNRSWEMMCSQIAMNFQFFKLKDIASSELSCGDGGSENLFVGRFFGRIVTYLQLLPWYKNWGTKLYRSSP